MTELLITTPLCLIHWDGTRPNILQSGKQEEGNGNFTGITWDERAVYVACSQDFRYGVQIFSRKFTQGVFLCNDLHQTHQILWANGGLHLCNTGKNRIEHWDGKSWTWTAFNPSPCDIDHLNGLWFDGRRFWVTEFRHRPERPSVVRVCSDDWQLLQTLTVGPPIHNLYIEGNCMYNLVSRQPKGLLRTRLGTGNQKRLPVRGEENNLVRGLARTAGNWFVGLGRWEKERGDRHKGNAQVVILDNGFREVDRIVIKDVGPTNDVRVIGEHDFAHNGVGW